LSDRPVPQLALDLLALGGEELPASTAEPVTAPVERGARVGADDEEGVVVDDAARLAGHLLVGAVLLTGSAPDRERLRGVARLGLVGEAVHPSLVALGDLDGSREQPTPARRRLRSFDYCSGAYCHRGPLSPSLPTGRV